MLELVAVLLPVVSSHIWELGKPTKGFSSNDNVLALFSSPSIHPHYILKYSVVDDFGARRAPHRDAVIALAGRYKREGRLVMAGALGDLTGATFVFSSREAAEAFMVEDPYINNGLVTSHELAEWSVVM